MGEIIRNVRLQAIDGDGDPTGPEVVVSGVIDSGTTSLIISRALATTLRAHLIADGTIVEDAYRAVTFLRATIVAPRCMPTIAIAVVDDDLADRAGVDPTTDVPYMLVGHDVLQSSRAALRFARGTSGGRPRDTIVCEDPRRRPRANPDDEWQDCINRDDRRRR